MNARGFNVYAALEETFGLEDREALPTGTPVRTVPLSEAGLRRSEIRPGRSRRRRLLGVARPGARGDLGSDAAAGGPAPWSCSTQATANGFLQRAFEAGADDLIALPQPPGQLEFALEKAVARRRNAGSGATEGR